MKLKDTLSALPGIFLLALVGCGIVVSQSPEPAPKYTAAPMSAEPTPTASATPSPTPKPQPTLKKNELQICGEIFEKTQVTAVMHSEINRIRKDYGYICDIDWNLFISDDTWGQAWTPGADININEDYEMYRIFPEDTDDHLSFQIRQTIRHEFGHQVIFQVYGMPSINDEELEIFGTYAADPIYGEVLDGYTADEHAADVVAAALSPDPSSPYVTRYSEEQIDTALDLLDTVRRIR